MFLQLFTLKGKNNKKAVSNECFVFSDRILKWAKKDYVFDRKMSRKFSSPYEDII
jgi:hypothetical protein